MSRSHKKKTAKTQIYEGVLYKQGKLSGGWKERFFVLYSDRTLSYYQSEDAWDQGKSPINTIDLQETRSIAPVNKQAENEKSHKALEKTKKAKSRRGSLSRKWSIDFSAIFSNKSALNNDAESDQESGDEVAFPELVIGTVYTFEIVQTKRTYALCTGNSSRFNKWLNKLEQVTFGKKVFKGWLLKLSERNKTWERRWFIIYDTLEMRYYDDATRAVSRGMAKLSLLKKITKMDDDRGKKKYKQTNVLYLEFQQRTLLVSCAINEAHDRKVWFNEICSALGTKMIHFVQPIYDDELYRYNEKTAKWQKFWFLLDKNALLQFRDMEHCDEYSKHGYCDEKDHKKAVSRYVTDQISLHPFDPKHVQKVRPGSNLQVKLIKECIFVLHSREYGKVFFATEQESQLSRWFKKIRSLAGDQGRKKSKSAVSVMTESSKSNALNEESQRSSNKGSRGGSKDRRRHRDHEDDGDEDDVEYSQSRSKHKYKKRKDKNKPRKRSRDDSALGESKQPDNNNKNQEKILKILRELERDLNGCKKDARYIKQCWEHNNEESDDDDDDEKVDDDDEY
mmetsp:Transcript_33927/g.55344  ORF Transcript_33927/g.55344 Transcript_33927/m.55344 type:complete len:564 (-) Transcript_33927:162-1853(-)